jgi:hypothetical protein
MKNEGRGRVNEQWQLLRGRERSENCKEKEKGC